MWLDDRRGHVVDWSTQRWVRATGRRVSLDDHAFLDGPRGKPRGIGTDVFNVYAAESALRVVRSPSCGLLRDFAELRGPGFDPRRVSPAVADFYEHTSAFDLDVWSQWRGAFWPFGWALAVLFSRRLQQLNVPLSGLDTSRGMTSELTSIVRAGSDEHQFTAWVRALRGTGQILYAGAYSSCEVPGQPGRCVRVVFPLPNGNAIVIMKPVAHADGSLTLISAGDGFGAPGFYFTLHDRERHVWARYLRSFRETIRVYAADDGVRADHTLTLWSMTFLRLHYRCSRTALQRRRPDAAEAARHLSAVPRPDAAPPVAG